MLVSTSDSGTRYEALAFDKKWMFLHYAWVDSCEMTTGIAYGAMMRNRMAITPSGLSPPAPAPKEGKIGQATARPALVRNCRRKTTLSAIPDA